MTASPIPSLGPTREEIARIIDAEAFAPTSAIPGGVMHDALVARCRYAEAKADAILALFPVEAGDVGWRPGDLHTAMMDAIREDIIRQHPGAFTEDTDAEIVIPVGAVPVNLYCKIDVSALAEAALAAASPPLAEGQEHE